MQRDVVLFDFDGTLVDSTALILAAYRHAFTELRGAPLPDELWLRGIGTPLLTQLRELASDEAETLLLLDAYRGFAVENHDELIRPIDGVDELIQTLVDAGVRLGIVTSKRRIGVDRGMAACGLRASDFGAFVCSDDIDVHKPDPAPVIRALELLDAAPGRAIFIGDSVHDLVAGRRAGVSSGAALWGPFDRDQLHRGEPEYWLDEPMEVVDLLRL